MSKRIIVILALGGAAIAALAAASRYISWQNRPVSDDERRAQVRQEMLLQFERDGLDWIAKARTEKERRYATYEYRMFKYEQEEQGLSAHLDMRNGVDDFEALVIASVYFRHEFGLCGIVELPELKGQNWEASIGVGRTGEPGPPIIVNARTGAICCAGHRSVENPMVLFEAPSRTGK